MNVLMEALRLAQRKRFGASSEKSEDTLSEQLSFLFNEAEVFAEEQRNKEDVTVVAAHISVVTVAVTLRQNNRMIEESTRPYISVYTDEINTGNPLFYLIIKNFGKSPAYITKFESDFDFRGCYKIPTDKDYLGNLKNAVFAPGQSRICMLDYAKIGKEITFTLEYHSGAKKKYSEKFTIDLKAGVSMPYGKAATEGKELRTISYTLQEMLQKNL